jgi:hypothetical protein
MVSVSFSIANIISPQTFQARDAPNYLPAKVTIVASITTSVLVAIMLRMLYGHRNTRADERGEPAMSNIEARAVRSRKSLEFSDPGFRYAI